MPLNFELILTDNKAKILKMCVSRTRPTVRKHFFLCDLQQLFFFFFGYRKSWPEVPIIVPEFTFGTGLHVARIWRNQICEWMQSILKKTNIF